MTTSETQEAKRQSAIAEYQTLRAEREQAMAVLRAAVKSRCTYGDIAQASGNSTNWIGTVLRGNYPGYGANLLPKNIRLALEGRGFQVPECLKTY